MRSTLGTTARKSAVVLGVLTIVVLVVLVVGWRHDGRRWFVVTTPSMGTVAPTGSLVLTAPTTVARTSVGDLVTFTSPTSETVFTHRVTEVTREGLHTKGDVNAVPDAWTITDEELIGEVVFHTPGLGWVLRAVPLVFIGNAMVWIITGWLQPRRRSSARLMGASLTVAVVGYLLKPWVGIAKLGQSAPGGRSRDLFLEVVSTGTLPIRVGAAGGPAGTVLSNGQTATVRFPGAADNTDYALSTHLALGFWWWAALVVVCLAPLIWSTVVGLAPDDAAVTT